MAGLVSIFRRELQVRARQPATYRIRLIAGAIILSIFGGFALTHYGSANVLGVKLFGICSTLLFLYALLSGVALTADCLSEEKREGTLGLLFLTQMTSAEVVLGKMGVQSLRAIYGLIAAIPVLTICVLFGGVRGGDAFQTVIVLLATTFFSLTTGVFVSARAVEDRSAFLGTLGLVAALSLLPPLLWQIIQWAAGSAPEFIRYASPIYPFTRPRWSPDFAGSLAVLGLIGTGFLINAAFRLSRSFAEPAAVEFKGASASIKRLAGRTNRWMLDHDPFDWLLHRETILPRTLRLLAILALLVGIPTAVSIKHARASVVIVTCLFSLLGSSLLLKTLVAADAMRSLHQDHRSGALELLFSTPIDPNSIAQAQVRRTTRRFLPVCLAFATVYIIFFLQKELDELFIIALGGSIFLFVDSRALIWTAMRQAFKPNRYPPAVMRVTGAILAPPLAIIALVLFTGRGMSTERVNTIFFFWFVASGGYDAILIHRAKKSLADLRLLASTGSPSEQKPRKNMPKALQWLLMAERSSA